MPTDLRRFRTYDEARESFRWDLPESYNIAVDVCDRHTTASGPAAIHVGDAGVETASFASLSARSSRLASALAKLGLRKGSRVCAVLPSTLDSLVITLAVLKVGAVLSQPGWAAPAAFFEHPIQIFDPDVLFYDPRAWPQISAWVDPRRLRCVVVANPAASGSSAELMAGHAEAPADHLRYADLLASGDEAFTPVATGPDDPAIISFTSGSTGKPKAVAMAHRFVLGVVPAIQMLSELGPQPGDVFFASLGWNQLGGLRPAVFPAWHLGCTVVATDRVGLGSDDYYALLSAHRVSVAHIMPSMLKKMWETEAPGRRFDLSALRAIYYTGEPLSPKVESWFRDELGVAVNPYYGSAELSMLTSGCSRWFASRPGSAAKPIPGRRLTILDEQTLEPVPAGRHGIVAIDRHDPALALGYWRQEELFARSFHGDHFLSTDVCTLDADGYLWYLGRRGEVIRGTDGVVVTPNVIETPALANPGVKDAAAVQLADPASGQRYVLLCIVPRPGVDEAVLAGQLAKEVGAALPAALQPLRVRMLAELPHTQGTNKLQRSKLLRMFGTTA